jgi:hypothetical protein
LRAIRPKNSQFGNDALYIDEAMVRHIAQQPNDAQPGDDHRDDHTQEEVS